MPATLRRPFRKLARRAAVASALGLAVALALTAGPAPARAQGDKGYGSVAILEFRFEHDYNDAFIGLMSEMQSALVSAVQEGSSLKMPSRDAVKGHKGAKDLRAAGRALGVQAVVDCEVKRINEKDGVICRLIDVESGSELFSKTLTWAPTLEETRAVKDKNAKELAAGIRAKLTGAGPAVAVDADAIADKVFKKIQAELRDIVRKEMADQNAKLRADIAAEVRKALADAGGVRPGAGVGVAVLEWTVEDDYVAEFKTMMSEMYDLMFTDIGGGAGVRLVPRERIKGAVGKEPRAAGKDLGARVVVTAFVGRHEGKDSILVKMIDVESGGELFSKRLSWEPTIDATRAIKEKYAKELAGDIKAKLPR